MPTEHETNTGRTRPSNRFLEQAGASPSSRGISIASILAFLFLAVHPAQARPDPRQATRDQKKAPSPDMQWRRRHLRDKAGPGEAMAVSPSRLRLSLQTGKPGRDTSRLGSMPPDWLKSPAMRLKVRDWRWKYRWYVMYGGLALGWAITVGVGRFAWKWGQSHEFRVHSDGWFAKRPDLDGGSDKFGHMYTMYALERGFTYVFESLGIPHWAAVLSSSLNSALTGVAIEFGDGFTAAYGFSYSDIVFDLMGTVLGLVQDIYPPLRNVFALSYWYWPSSGFLSKRNPHKEKALTDYSGSKYFFHVLGSGIPYVRDTPMRYLRLDLGFWSRGFKEYDEGFPFHMRQYIYVGMSVDFAQLVWDLFPHKWYRTSTYVFLKYFNLYGPFETGYKFER